MQCECLGLNCVAQRQLLALPCARNAYICVLRWVIHFNYIDIRAIATIQRFRNFATIFSFSCIVPKVQQQQQREKTKTALQTVDRQTFVPTLCELPLWQRVCLFGNRNNYCIQRPLTRVQHNTPYKLKLTSIALLPAPLLPRPQLQQQRTTHSNTIKPNLQVACWFTRIKLKSTSRHETICIAPAPEASLCENYARLKNGHSDRWSRELAYTCIHACRMLNVQSMKCPPRLSVAFVMYISRGFNQTLWPTTTTLCKSHSVRNSLSWMLNCTPRVKSWFLRKGFRRRIANNNIFISEWDGNELVGELGICGYLMGTTKKTFFQLL